MSNKVITFVTGNAKKLEEFKAIMGSQFPHSLVSKDVDLPEFQGTPIEVVTEKCKEAARYNFEIGIVDMLTPPPKKARICITFQPFKIHEQGTLMRKGKVTSLSPHHPQIPMLM